MVKNMGCKKFDVKKSSPARFPTKICLQITIIFTCALTQRISSSGTPQISNVKNTHLLIRNRVWSARIVLEMLGMNSGEKFTGELYFDFYSTLFFIENFGYSNRVVRNIIGFKKSMKIHVFLATRFEHLNIPMKNES